MKNTLLLLAILILATGFRLWGISSYPSGLNADEAALGYNAYSLLTTGRDEHGHKWPVNLESFGDFKPAGYAYLLTPFVKVLGLTELAVRLPSALFGIGTVYLLYLFILEISSRRLALLSAAVLAVSPWHVHFSRGGWEVNVATTLILLGVLAAVKWLKSYKRGWFLVWGLSFVVSMYIYQSARLTAPLMGLGLGLCYWKDLWKNKGQTLIVTLIVAILLIPLGWSIVKTDAGSRLNGVGLLADLGPINRVNELRGHYSLVNPPIYVKFLYNKVVAYALQFGYNYLTHFEGNFLFVNGDVIQRSKVPETGLLYLADFIFVLIGVVIWMGTKNKFSPIIWLWLLIAPVAAAATFQVPHALRAHGMVIPLSVLIAVGLSQITTKYRKILIVITVLLYAWQVGRFAHQYYVHYPQEFPSAWEYGFKELVAYIDLVSANYDQVWITDKYDQPYILFLFYQKYPANKFQNNHTLTVRDRFNFSTVRDYDKYHFGLTNPPPGSLVVATPEEVEDTVSIMKTINFPNGQPAFEIYVQK